jgi:hypothetical protein
VIHNDGALEDVRRAVHQAWMQLCSA